MEIKDLESFYINETSQTLDVTFRILNDNEDEIRTDQIDLSETKTFGYEFFLRMTHNSVKIMSIPRIGYKHVNLREGSIFWNYKKGDNMLTDDEVRFWVDSAKKEYFFINDRAIKFEPQEV